MSQVKWRSPELLAAISARYDGTTKTINQLVQEFNVPRYSIFAYAKQLGVLRKKKVFWSDKEIDWLADNWHRGREYCAKKLKKSPIAVNLKAKRLGLGGCFKGQHLLSCHDVARIMGLGCSKIVAKWIERGMLKGKLAPSVRKIHQIELDNLEEFLKSNPHLWDSRKFTSSLWPKEPEWFKEKKLCDNDRPPNKGKKWTPEEDKKAIAMYKTGNFTHQKIGDALGRSYESVERRISRLDVWGTGQYIGYDRR